jgi:hypothetical protein
MFSILLIKILVHCVEFHRKCIPNQLFAKTDYIRNRIPVGRSRNIDKSRAPSKRTAVLGIGVAECVSVSTLAAIVLICLINSKLCSSSTIKPRSLKLHFY